MLNVTWGVPWKELDNDLSVGCVEDGFDVVVVAGVRSLLDRFPQSPWRRPFEFNAAQPRKTSVVEDSYCSHQWVSSRR
jgi:hypothetical protein